MSKNEGSRPTPPQPLAERLIRAFHECWSGQQDQYGHAYSKVAFQEFEPVVREAAKALAAMPSESEPSEALKAINHDLKMTLHALLDRDITYERHNAVLPFESHDQAINHIAEARRKGRP